MKHYIYTLKTKLAIGSIRNETWSNISRCCTARLQFRKGHPPLVLEAATFNGCVSIKGLKPIHGPGILRSNRSEAAGSRSSMPNDSFKSSRSTAVSPVGIRRLNGLPVLSRKYVDDSRKGIKGRDNAEKRGFGTLVLEKVREVILVFPYLSGQLLLELIICSLGICIMIHLLYFPNGKYRFGIQILWDRPWKFTLHLIVLVVTILNFELAFCASEIEWHSCIPSNVLAISRVDLTFPGDVLIILMRLTQGTLSSDKLSDMLFEPKRALLSLLSAYANFSDLLDKIQELGKIRSLDEPLARALTERAENLIAHTRGIHFIASLCVGLLHHETNGGFRELMVCLDSVIHLLEGRELACIGLAGLPPMPSGYSRFVLPLQDSVIRAAVSMIRTYSDPGIPEVLRVLCVLRENADEPLEDYLTTIVAETIWDLSDSDHTTDLSLQLALPERELALPERQRQLALPERELALPERQRQLALPQRRSAGG